MYGERNTMPKRKTDPASVKAVSDRLKALHLNAMAEGLEVLDQGGELYQMAPLEVLNQLIALQQISSDNRITDRYKRSARLFFPMADLSNILYLPDRHINAALMDELATNQYIDNSRNVLITSATGCGKTFCACALGNNACNHQYSVRYFTMMGFLDACEVATEKRREVKFISSVEKVNLIILDDFMLTSIDKKETEYLYRLVSERPRKIKPRSFIICSQLMKDEMYTRLSQASPGLADAIMNRICAKAYEFQIQGDSMRDRDIEAELKRLHPKVAEQQ